MIYKNIVITGGNNGDSRRARGLYGDIRGWDARTGKLLWSFHTVPRAGEPGVETWEGDSWKNRSGTNVWGVLHRRHRARPRRCADGRAHLRFLWRRSARRQSLRQLRRGARCGHRKADVVPAIGASRHLGLRFGRRADAGGRQTEWPHNSRRRGDDEDVAGLHLRSRNRRADLRHRRAAGAAGRVPGEATWPTQPFPVQPPPLARTPSIRRRTSTT